MTTGPQSFGTTPDGAEVRRVQLAGGGLRAAIMSWGASIQELWLDGHDRPLTLGFERLEDYLEHSLFYGAIVGRYANRIAHGRFTLDGERFQADVNEATGHTLHGGRDGIWRRNWEIADSGSDHVTLTLRDPDGVMGFPGNLDITCTYRLKPPATLAVELAATTDAPTLCNLAHHSWFNLDDGGAGDVRGHRLMIAAAAYTPVGADLIPTGVVQPVGGSAFDFRQARPIRNADGADAISYDHNFCLAAARRPLLQAAWVQGARSGVEMEVWTTEPGLQFFDGDAPERPVPGLRGIRYRPHAALCLEPQVWPDSPNRPYFPQAVLRPDETYRQSTEYRFGVA
jgi:aldose 1-epimerase